MLKDVFAYYERGWNCIPFRVNAAEKKPVVSWKRYQTARPTEQQLMQWFGRKDVNGVGIITGPGQGPLAVRDFDSVGDYERWAKFHPGWARELPTVRTLRGYHVYANSDHPTIVKLSDGEYRGAGLTLAPPTTRGDFKYHWVTPLPTGALPSVPHRILLGEGVAEIAECHGSALSAVSATSPPHPDPPVSDISAVSALSAISATCPADFVIGATQPQTVGERNKKLLDLARGLKFNAGLSKATPDELRTLVRRWHELAVRVIGTKEFDITWADFLHAWDRARHRLGADVLDEAARRVDLRRLPPAAEKYGETTGKLIGLCEELASLTPNRRFFLSSHYAAEYLALKPVEAWRLLNMLVSDGVLERMEFGNQHRATRYRFVAALPPSPT